MQSTFGFQQPKAILVTKSTDGYFDESVYRCPVCGWEAALTEWDCLGADIDGMFCNGCNEECDMSTED